jgi:outer membrane protein assembly factor BamD
MLASCSKFRKIQKSPDWRLKYDAALDYYAKEKYYKSSVLLEEILPIIRGTKEAELGTFYFAYAYFHQEQYILSAHHFREFVRTFGRSEYVMEASYMHGISLYMQSPDYNLDQTVTYEAVDVLQNFIEKYPAAEQADIADSLIQEMQVKLETKAYYNAKLYHKIGRHKAALVVFENFHQDFPDSDFREEIYYLGIAASYEYAKVSIPDRQEERFKDSAGRYQNFIDRYPNSEFLEDAEEIYAKTQKELAKFADQNS